MNKSLLTLVAALFIAGLAQAEFIEVPEDTAAVAQTKAAEANVQVTIAQTVRPASLGRHHIAASWFGFSKAGSDMELPYLDATAGESGFLQYRYAFTRHVDAVVDCRAWVNDVDDDSIVYNIKSQVGGFGFGVRYNFGGFKASHPWVFPYLQASLLRVDIEVESRNNKQAWYTTPEYFWSRKGSGWGGAIGAGLDIRLGKLISVPVDVACFLARPRVRYDGWILVPRTVYGDTVYIAESDRRLERFNVSSLCLSAGVSFNWGKL